LLDIPGEAMHRPAPSGENQKPAGPPDVLVIGGGRFGRLAARRLGRRVLAVVEPDPAPELREMGVRILQEDGPAAAFRFLKAPSPPAWIAPCLPRHLLWEWLRLESQGVVESLASDLHLSAEEPPMIRVNGEIKKIKVPTLFLNKPPNSTAYFYKINTFFQVTDVYFYCVIARALLSLSRFIGMAIC
jgi:hypothetical protein